MSSQELLPHNESQVAPFGGNRNMMSSVNAGSVSIEQERAIAEARGQIQVAQMFPRDVARARAELMDECDCIEFAQVAFYSVPRAGGSVTGPSIRLAEAAAGAYGHMIWGHRELSRSEDKSEVEVYAWDMQKNNKRIRQITVDHYRDTKNGRVRLRDEKEVQDKIANVASKQMRGCILALVSKSFVEAAVARCRQTLAGGGGVPLKQRVEKMIDAFAKLGVNADILTKHLGHSLDQTSGDELVDLLSTYNAIKGGDKIADHFGAAEQSEQGEQAAASLAETAKAGAAKAAAKPAAKEKSAAAAKPAEKPSAESKPAAEQTEAGNAKAEAQDSNAAENDSNAVKENDSAQAQNNEALAADTPQKAADIF